MEPFTFETLPKAVTLLYEKLSNIERLLQAKQEPQAPEATPLTIQQVTDYLPLSMPTVYSFVSRAQIPVRKNRKYLYFSKRYLIKKHGTKCKKNILGGSVTWQFTGVKEKRLINVISFIVFRWKTRKAVISIGTTLIRFLIFLFLNKDSAFGHNAIYRVIIQQLSIQAIQNISIAILTYFLFTKNTRKICRS